MTVAAKDERIAILLSSLGSEFTNSVMKHLPEDQVTALKSTIQQLESDPPTDEEFNDVLVEFNRFMDFVLSNDAHLARVDAPSSGEAVSEFISTGDPFQDLASLQDYQIAGALRNESGGAIAIILAQLPDERVSAIMQKVPSEVQEDAFLRLQSSPQMDRSLLSRIVESVVAKASLLDQNAASDPAYLADEKTASLLRSMDRKTRTVMLRALEKSSPDVAGRVKDMLFMFEDIVRFTDKSIQRVLTEVETAELATTLKNADPAVTDRIASNLSKRAKTTLMEEIEFLGSVSTEQEEEAQKKICAVFAKLDQAGDLEMIE